MYNKGGYRHTAWPLMRSAPFASHTSQHSALRQWAGVVLKYLPKRPIERLAVALLIALALAVIGVFTLSIDRQDMIDRRERRVMVLVQQAAQHIDAALQSSALLAQLLANRPPEPGGEEALRRLLLETMQHAPMVFAVVLADPNSAPLSFVRQPGTQRFGGTPPAADDFAELDPRRNWGGVTLLHPSETSRSASLLGLRARAAGGRHVTLYVRGNDLPSIGHAFGRSWLLGSGRQVAVALDQGGDPDAEDATLRAWRGQSVAQDVSMVSRVKLADGMHQMMSSRLDVWQLTLMADAGRVQLLLIQEISQQRK